ncbi:hypothetical protein BN7_5424 [Wickerhamomyces ciferrii]|uniref:Replication factor A protein 3 n=1 Tax=Wickerhamomyces ciferrii (strain ATCC 14091 / BCRC 22168 / CBS 111 / JCM 3599 / NBRC 0793 / NRRL Y-1031 F-60-10) TaxID=1206466 RepID=K0KXQ3_WICCF|nr:uncharacterized protein BN7_5424 [Wickerhamomyces ciferrii]CCH45838.1 hypothetical protein BN7_5424 [Wickerhamomyces ciferrii]
MDEMHLVTNLNDIKKYHKKNHVVKVRVFGTVMDFNPRKGSITIQSINLFTQNIITPGTVILELDPDRSLTNPEVTYIGTLVDVYGLYDGDKVMLLDVKFPGTSAISNDENITILKQMSNLDSI